MADAVRANQVLVLESGEEYTARYRLPAPWGAGGLVALPLIVGDRVIGGMELRFPSQRPLDVEDHAFLRTLADLCAQALDRAGLYEAERQAHAQAAAAVQARDEFLAIAAHELKTPVTSLRGFAQLLLRLTHREHHIGAPPVRLALQHIDEQSHKLHALVVQLLDLSRIEAGRLSLEKADVDLVELVEGVVTAAQAQASTHALVVDAPRPARACVDPLRIEQVLVNLVHNAIKFSPNGGLIDLSVLQSEGTVQVVVRDRGLGIPPEHRAHLFDRFYQAHAQSHRSGMGLGLHISRHIVELHGGSITPGFPADGGVCFVVALPTGHDQTPTPA
jgi:signal transduction histidine kinase